MSSLLKFFYARPQDVGMVIVSPDEIVRLMNSQMGESTSQVPPPDSPYAQAFTALISSNNSAAKKRGTKRKRYGS